MATISKRRIDPYDVVAAIVPIKYRGFLLLLNEQQKEEIRQCIRANRDYQ